MRMPSRTSELAFPNGTVVVLERAYGRLKLRGRLLGGPRFTLPKSTCWPPTWWHVDDELRAGVAKLVIDAVGP